MKYAIFLHVCRMLALKTQERPVLQGLTDATRKEHRRWLALGREDVQTGVRRIPSSESVPIMGPCLSYDLMSAVPLWSASAGKDSRWQTSPASTSSRTSCMDRHQWERSALEQVDDE